MPEQKKQSGKTIASNKKAWHDYFVDETYEAGIELFGTEVKSVRIGRVNLKDSYCIVKGNELFALGIHISPYEMGNIFNRDPLRQKRLLMHRREIVKLSTKVNAQGYTLVPLSLYFSNQRVKVELGLCRGKKNYDKREALAEKEAQRTAERFLKGS